MWKDTVRRLLPLPKPNRLPISWWGLAFLLLSLLSGLAGFGVLPNPAPGVAKALLFIFLFCFLVDVGNALAARRRGRTSG